MCAKSLHYDGILSYQIYKENINSLITLAEETLVSNAQQNIDNLIFSIDNPNEEDIIKNELFERAKHLANIDWLFLNSLLISFYSYFEFHLYALSKVVEEKSNSKIKIEHISGNGINQYLNYLNLVGQIEKADKGRKEWQIIQVFRKLRNILVHEGNIMIHNPAKKLQEHELFDFLTSQEVIMAGSLGHIRIRNTKILKTFAEITFKQSENLIVEIKNKFQNEY